MSKIFVFWILILCINASPAFANSGTGKPDSISGYELLDAIKIDSLLKIDSPINGQNRVAVLSIYQQYCYAIDTTTDSVQFLQKCCKFHFDTIIANQIFPKRTRGSNAQQLSVPSGAGASLSPQQTSGSSFLSAPDVANAIANFVIERAKEELYTAFFIHLDTILNRYPAIGSLFPQSTSQLNNIGDNIFNFSIYLQNLRQAFTNDLGNLPTDIQIAEDKVPLNSFFNQRPGFKVLLNSGLYIADELKDHAHPGDIIENLDISEMDSVDRNGALKETLFTVQLLNHSIHGTDSTVYWVTPDQIKALASSPVAIAAYFSLLELSANKRANEMNDPLLTSFANTDFPKALNLVYTDIKDAQKFILRLGARIKTIEATVKTINTKEKKNEKILISDYSSMLIALADLLELPTDPELLNLVSWDQKPLGKTHMADYRRIIELMKSGGNLYLDISNQSYGAAIAEIGIILNNSMGKSISDGIKNDITNYIQKLDKTIVSDSTKKVLQSKIDDLTSGLISGNTSSNNGGIFGGGNATSYANLITAISALPTSLQGDVTSSLSNLAQRLVYSKLQDSSTDIIANFLKIGSFVAAVSQAQNADDVSQALEAAALPVGSYMIKRKSNPSVMINSFIGAYVGEEKIGNQPSWSTPIYGMALPVGVSFNLLGGSLGSFSFFASVLDLSAIAALRSSGDTTKPLPAFAWQNIISLGGYVSIGILDWPVSLNVGYQAGPALQTVTSTNLNLRQENYSRMSVSLVVDVPLFTLYASSPSP